MKVVSLLPLIAFGLLGQEPELGPAPRIDIPFKTNVTTTPVKAAAELSTWVDISSREAVRTFYLDTFVPSAAAVSSLAWNGSVSGCSAGTISQTYKDAVALRVNWFRSMAGVPPGITLDASLSSQDQEGALMISANRALSHSPPASWTCYTAAGATALGRSNICYWYGSFNDPGCVALYIRDHGSNNYLAGHRRWILYPQTTTMGTGDVSQTGSGSAAYPIGNALWVIPANFGGTRPATREEFVAWPPAGYVPYQVVYPRWSFAYPGADFSNATVSMARNSQNVTVQLETRANGYGDNTLVWITDGLDANSYSANWARPAQDTPVDVTISNVRINGLPRNFTYRVIVFDPATGASAAPGAPATPAPANGATNVSTSTSLSWAAASGATSYDVYFGTQATPPQAGTTATTAYDPGTLNPGTTFYWRVVSRNTGGTASSPTWSFTTGPPPCNYSATQVSGSIQITTSTGCAWTATSNAAWIVITSGASGSGSGTVTYTLTPNLSTQARSGAITAAGFTFPFTQAGVTPGSGGLSIGAYSAGTWTLDRNGNYVVDAPPADGSVFWSLGQPGEVPVRGDWNGSGTTKVGLYRGGTWLLDYNGNGQWDGPAVDKLIYFGGPGYVPFVGDWNGSGATKIAVHQNGTWLIDFNGNFAWDGPATDKLIFFGGAGYEPLIGDWNGSGTSKLAVHQNGTWIIDYNGNFQWDGAATDRLVFFGGSGWTPVVGDWNGSGTTKVGAYNAGLWVLDQNGNYQWDGTSVDKLAFFGGAGYTPMVGDWSGNGATKVGAFSAGQWVLDVNGNFTWDPPADQVTVFGGVSSTPVTGKW